MCRLFDPKDQHKSRNSGPINFQNIKFYKILGPLLLFFLLFILIFTNGKTKTRITYNIINQKPAI